MLSLLTIWAKKLSSVEMVARLKLLSVSGGRLPRAFIRREYMRSRISLAAFLVNVSVRISSGFTPSSITRRRKRQDSTAVFPAPAPAETTVLTVDSITLRCSGLGRKPSCSIICSNVIAD